MDNKCISTEKFPVLSYRIYGDGNTIVLLHGFPLDGSIWNEVAEELANEYRVIVPDIPGSGASTFAGEELSVEDMAESVLLILKAESIDNAIIAGHSMGGYAAIAFADLHPEMTAGLGMIHSSAAPDTEEKKEQRRKSIELFKKGGKNPFIKQMVPNLFASGSRQGINDTIDKTTEIALLTDNKSLIAFYNAMINRPDRRPTLKSSDIPVLWVIGEEDEVIPHKNLIQQTSHANVNFVYTHSNCGHMGMLEVPEAVIEDIQSFAAYCYRLKNK